MKQKRLIPSLAQVTIHPSQFPEAVRRKLLNSLRTRRMNHKFHYDSVKQVQKWLAVHQAYSPWCNDRDCRAVYQRAFKETVARIRARVVHVIGLGCGTGQKDIRLIKLLRANGKTVFYVPCDSSVPMVLAAYSAAIAAAPAVHCRPVVCDLATADDLADLLGNVFASRCAGPTNRPSRCEHPMRLITFFGMLPNFEPLDALRRLASLVRPGDVLLLSANFLPGPATSAAPKNVLRQYDNALTRDWLMTFLLDLGVDNKDGALRFGVEPGQLGVTRIVAKFQFNRKRALKVGRTTFGFEPPDTIQLFFSYRYTPDQLEQLLARHGFAVTGRWITRSGEEGVFRCRRA